MHNIKKLIFKTETGNSSYSYQFSSTGATLGGSGCELSPLNLTLYSSSSVLGIGVALFSDSGLLTPFIGNNLFWNSSEVYSYRISTEGIITAEFQCGGTLFRYRRDGSQQPGDPEFHIPYVVYIDVNGNQQTEYLSMDTDDCSEIYGLSIVEAIYAFSCSS